MHSESQKECVDGAWAAALVGRLGGIAVMNVVGLGIAKSQQHVLPYGIEWTTAKTGHGFIRSPERALTAFHLYGADLRAWKLVLLQGRPQF